jgi:hypothetical protein
VVSDKAEVSTSAKAAPVPADAFPAQAVRVEIETMSISNVIKFFILKFSYPGMQFLWFSLVENIRHNGLVSDGDYQYREQGNQGKNQG